MYPKTLWEKFYGIDFESSSSKNGENDHIQPLVKDLVRFWAEYGHFRHFWRTNSKNLFRKIFLNEFSDTLWVENVFKPVRAINRTDSEMIWNVYMFNWDLSISLPAADTVKKKYSPLEKYIRRAIDIELRGYKDFVCSAAPVFG